MLDLDITDQTADLMQFESPSNQSACVGQRWSLCFGEHGTCHQDGGELIFSSKSEPDQVNTLTDLFPVRRAGRSMADTRPTLLGEDRAAPGHCRRTKWRLHRAR
jgi:hypothetical protein